MRINRHAAAIVRDREIAIRGERHIDPRGVAGHRLVHGIVQHFGEEVVQRLLVRAANIHAGAAAHGLQPLQHLDVGSGIALLAARFGGRLLGLWGPGQIVEKIVGHNTRSRIVSRTLTERPANLKPQGWKFPLRIRR